MDDLGDLFADPNGPAYTKREERTGPPLDYVQHKPVYGLEVHHRLLRTLAEAVAKDADSADIVGQARHSFYYQLVAFLALSNMLALANDSDLVERLEAYSPAEFRDWIQRIERESTVSDNG